MQERNKLMRLIKLYFNRLKYRNYRVQNNKNRINNRVSKNTLSNIVLTFG